MFYTKVDGVYTPTTLGNVCLAAIIILMISLAIILTRHSVKKHKDKSSEEAKKAEFLSIKQLIVCAICLALGTVLSEFKLFELPFGGSITLFSMLVMTLPGLFFGLATGLLSGVSYGILQLIIGPYVIFPSQLIVDYVLAFGALGLSGLFYKRKNGIIKGYIVAVLGRYFFAFLSGLLFFSEYASEYNMTPVPYSLIYNGSYIIPEAVITVAVLCIPSVVKSIKRVKKEATDEN